MPDCALCGTPAPPPFRAPPPEGAPDLDGRPGEPTRSTLHRWLQRCRGCGAFAPDLAVLPPDLAAVVHSPAYQAERSSFLRWAMLASNTDAEGEALLQAAWSAEDAGEPSATLRRRAAEAWQTLTAPDAVLRCVDVLRRASLFADAQARLDSLGPMEGAAAAIAELERRLIATQDGGRYLLSSALRPPARSPHVTHRRPETKGLWGRLFGSIRP